MTIFEKKPGKDFKILNLTDLHMVDADWRDNSEKLVHLKATADEWRTLEHIYAE